MASAPPSESLVVDLPPDVGGGEFGESEATTKRKLAVGVLPAPLGRKGRKRPFGIAAIWSHAPS